MDFNKFQDICKEEVVKYTQAHMDVTDAVNVTTDDVYVVWYSKTLQHAKVLLSTRFPDGMYYELTYNGDKGELYFDAYKKFENKCIVLGGK